MVNMLLKVLYNNFRVSKKAVEMLDPFLRYVLLQPQPSVEYLSQRTGLMSALVHAVSVAEDDTVRLKLFEYLVDLIQGLQVSLYC